ncbi:MAG: hypothetical protein AB1642_09735 [Pseudomonadota bacterium]
MAGRRPDSSQRGAALLILMILLVTAAMTYVVSSLTPADVEAKRARQTNLALRQAREALLGYALRYRDDQIADGNLDRVYGYLPLPDLGSSRNNNTSCTEEGCDAANFSGNALYSTVVGRLPWRTLGLPPLRDGANECLWYAVSGSHQRQQRVSPMNADTLGHLDIVVADGTSALSSVLASAHDRPVAVIFSAGPPLTGQDRGTSAGDDVTQCGGNYDAANYLDPSTATALGGVTNYLAGTNNASAVTGDGDAANDPDSAKSLHLQGKVFQSGGNLLPTACTGSDCTLLANDTGLPVTGDMLFEMIRNSSSFRVDINSMLDRMTGCLRDKVAAGSGFVPKAITDYSPPADKSAGRVPDDTCYDDSTHPLGYYSHYSDLFFVAKAAAGDFTATIDGAAQSCPGVLVFANQRGATQSRYSASTRNSLANYLESSNLSSFRLTGTDFSGDSLLDRVSNGQTKEQDIVRCIPSGATLTEVESADLTAAEQLVDYDPATGTLTLGKEGITSYFYDVDDLYGCAWMAETRSIGSGFRSYFQFTFDTVGTNVGYTGFFYAAIDAESNVSLPCGMAGSHLGYSGDNDSTAPLAYPKLGIEFDQSRNSGFTGDSETSTNARRNDPCYASSCGGSNEYNTHAAIVYWGHESANATDLVDEPDYDDNVHGFPSTGSLAATRQPPKNPNASPGIEYINLRTGGQLHHVRVEVTPTRVTDAATPENSYTSLQTKVWIIPDGVTATNQIAAMENTTRPMSQLLTTTFQGTLLSDTAKIYDVAGAACVSGTCASGQTCGTDNVCYRQGLGKVRLGFTGSQRTNDQKVTITDIFTSWIP